MDVEHSENRLYLVFEWLDKDLKKYMDSCGSDGMGMPLIKSYMHQLLKGMAVCHSRGIMHREFEFSPLSQLCLHGCQTKDRKLL